MIASKKALVINNKTAYANSPDLLLEVGYDVDLVHKPDMGLRQLDTQDYDVIIVHECPEAESWQLCEKIRHLSGTPLIVISPHASTDTCVKAINAGADYFLRKSFGHLEFLARVNSLLQRTSPKQVVPIG